MKKLISYTFFLLCSASIQVPSTVVAQSGSDLANLSLEELMNIKVDVASGKATSLKQAPGIVTVLSEEEIKTSGARDLIDVLNLVPGIQFGVDVFGVTSVGVRGLWGHEGKVLMLWNGHELNELLFSTLQFGNHYPVNQIKRVEIMRGPGSALYGGNAELAVINVVTKSGADLNGGQVVASYGQNRETFARRNIELAYGESDGDLTYDVSAFVGEGTRSNRSYVDPFGGTSDLAQDSELNPGMLAANLKKGDLDARFLYDNYKTQQRDEFGEVLARPASSDFTSYFYDLRYHLHPSNQLTVTPRFSLKDQIPWRERPLGDAPNLELNRRAQRVQGEITAQYDPNETWSLLSGVQTYRDKARTYIEGDTFGNNEDNFGYHGYAILAQGTMHHSFADLTLGGRYDAHSLFDSQFVPRFSVTKQIDAWNLKLLASNAFRNPGIENISLNQQLLEQNTPDVAPIKREETTVLELEAGYQMTQRTTATLSVSHTLIRDPIVYSYFPDLQSEGYTNGDKVGSVGFEAEVKSKQAWGSWLLNYSHYKAVDAEVDTYDVALDSNSYRAFARNKVAGLLRYALTDNLSIAPSVLLLDSRYGTRTADPDGTFTLDEFDPVLLCNLYIGYTFSTVKGLEAGLGLYNLGGQNFDYIQPYDGGHAPLPGMAPEIMGRVLYKF